MLRVCVLVSDGCSAYCLCLNLKTVFCVGLLLKVIAASGAVKHEDIVEQVKKLFTKLSTDATTTAQLVAKEPAIFTGSEVRIVCVDYVGRLRNLSCWYI